MKQVLNKICGVSGIVCCFLFIKINYVDNYNNEEYKSKSIKEYNLNKDDDYLNTNFAFGFWNLSLPVSKNTIPTSIYPKNFNDLKLLLNDNPSYKKYILTASDSSFIDLNCTYT